MEKVKATFPPEWRLVLELRCAGVQWAKIAQSAGKSLRQVQNWYTEILERIRQDCPAWFT